MCSPAGLRRFGLAQPPLWVKPGPVSGADSKLGLKTRLKLESSFQTNPGQRLVSGTSRRPFPDKSRPTAGFGYKSKTLSRQIPANGWFRVQVEAGFRH
jgi:hypothetical protein